MCHLSARGKKAIAILGLFLYCLLLMGCIVARKQGEPVPVSPPCPSDRTVELESENKALRREMESGNEKVRSLEQEISKLRMQILENIATANDLKRRFDGQQKRLDATILEVVRAKEKLRSHESKAEAASTLAEAEVAVSELKKGAASADEVALEEISIVDHLLNMSIAEYKAQNFGGALYLANQTKGRVRDAQMRLDKKSMDSVIEGESLFPQPLSLAVLTNSNLREGPSLNDKIIGKLNKDETVIGYSFLGDWIRVETKAGMTGWVFQSLIGMP